MSWLYRLFLRWRDRHDAAWKPTGLRFTTARDYEFQKAVEGRRAADKRARVRLKIAARSAKPKAAKPQNVVAFRKAGQ